MAALTNPNNPAFNFQSGADEGDTIQVGIQATNTQTLRVSEVSVVSTPINQVITPAANQSFQAQDAIGQCDIGIDTLIKLSTQVGATLERLGIDQTNDNTAATTCRPLNRTSATSTSARRRRASPRFR